MATNRQKAIVTDDKEHVEKDYEIGSGISNGGQVKRGEGRK